MIENTTLKNNNPVSDKPQNSTTTEKKVDENSENRSGGFRKNRGRSNFRRRPADTEFQEIVVKIKRIIKVTKGGRRMRFSALVVVGDRKGKVGVGTGKANEVPDAIKKAIKNGRRNVQKISLIENRTIPHAIMGVAGASQVLLKPAPAGTGIIAGGAIASVIELSGIKDIYTKNLGAKAPINKVRATLNGLTKIHLRKEYLHIRSKYAPAINSENTVDQTQIKENSNEITQS